MALRASSSDRYKVGQQFEVADRKRQYMPADVKNLKTRFAALNTFVNGIGTAWIISLPGRDEITIETLEGSRVPGELRDLGYELTPAGEGKRIIAGSITERLGLTSSGAFEVLTPDSTKAVTETRYHSGIVPTQRYRFAL